MTASVVEWVHIFFVALFGAIVIPETLAARWVYSKDEEISRLLKSIKNQANLIKTMKEKNDPRKEKTIAKLENELKGKVAAGNSLNMRVNMLTSIATLICVTYIGSAYQNAGRTASLPFAVIWPFHMLTHRGLEGDDYTELSAIGLYFLIVFSLRPVVKKLAGWGLPKELDFLSSIEFLAGDAAGIVPS
jgi:uncharacterized membrane protein (DUF106 family)